MKVWLRPSRLQGDRSLFWSLHCVTASSTPGHSHHLTKCAPLRLAVHTAHVLLSRHNTHNFTLHNHITIRTFSSLGCICHYINIANCCHRCTIRHGQLLHTLKHHRSNAQSATFRIHFATIHINSYQPPHRLHNLASPAPSLLWLSQTQHLFHRNSLN